MSCRKNKENWVQNYDFQGNLLSEILTKSESHEQDIISKKSVLYDLTFYQGGFLIGSIEYFNTIHLYTPTNYLTQFGAYGNYPTQFKDPAGLTVNPQRDKLYVCDYKNNRVQAFSFELLTNSNGGNFIVNGGVYNSGDFTGDGCGDILVYCKGKKPNWLSAEDDEQTMAQAAILNVDHDELEEIIDIALPADWLFPGSFKVQKTLLGNSLGVFNSLVFCKGKQFKIARYWVDPLLIQNEVQEEKQIPISFRMGHIRASGDLNYDGNLDLILTQKQSVRVLLGPDYTNSQEITGLPKKLPGRVRAMYHEGYQDNVLVFQKGKRPAQGYFINSNFVATVGLQIPVTQRIRAMSGSIPVTQKRRTITMGSFMYQDPKIKGKRKFKVVGPR
ncbi:MAG: hypothetical protein R3F23_07580 [Verrucomicrobiia bacterium]